MIHAHCMPRQSDLSKWGDRSNRILVEKFSPAPQLLHDPEILVGSIQVVEVDLINAQKVGMISKPEFRMFGHPLLQTLQVPNLLGAHRRPRPQPPRGGPQRHPQLQAGHVQRGPCRAPQHHRARHGTALIVGGEAAGQRRRRLALCV